MVFPDDTIRLMFWTDLQGADVSAVINYTLAVPEPREHGRCWAWAAWRCCGRSC
ncbi:MAG: hypothetical protein R3C45_13315 [Phycisphaerales bacterium]